MKFPKEYELKVDLTRVNWEVMKVWIAQRVTELLGIEDDVLIGYVYEQLEGHKVQMRLFGTMSMWLMLALRTSYSTDGRRLMLHRRLSTLGSCRLLSQASWRRTRPCFARCSFQ